jgi:hypothetical protein
MAKSIEITITKAPKLQKKLAAVFLALIKTFLR